MPSPREIALKVNDRADFKPVEDPNEPPAKEPDYRANPVNPPEAKPEVKITRSK
jgi:hypothetical protein